MATVVIINGSACNGSGDSMVIMEIVVIAVVMVVVLSRMVVRGVSDCGMVMAMTMGVIT